MVYLVRKWKRRGVTVAVAASLHYKVNPLRVGRSCLASSAKVGATVAEVASLHYKVNPLRVG